MKSIYFLFTILIMVASTSWQNDDHTKSMQRGKQLYEDFCVTCHKSNGEGIANLYPPLAKSDYLLHKRKESIRAIKHGLKGKIKINGIFYNGVMQPLGLENDEVADVMNYILNSWGNSDLKNVTTEEVKSVVK